MTLVELLAEFGGVMLVARRSEACLAAALMSFPGGRRALVIERTYRVGIRLIMNPTSDETAVLDAGDLWELWNSERAELLDGAV